MGKSLDTITEREKEKIKRIHDRRNFKVPTGQLINLYCWAWNRLEEEVDDPEAFIIEAFDHIDPSLEYDEFAEELRDYLAPPHPPPRWGAGNGEGALARALQEEGFRAAAEDKEAEEEAGAPEQCRQAAEEAREEDRRGHQHHENGQGGRNNQKGDEGYHPTAGP